MFRLKCPTNHLQLFLRWQSILCPICQTQMSVPCVEQTWSLLPLWTGHNSAYPTHPPPPSSPLSPCPLPLWHLTLNTFRNSTPVFLLQKQNISQTQWCARFKKATLTNVHFTQSNASFGRLDVANLNKNNFDSILVSSYIQNTQKRGQALMAVTSHVVMFPNIVHEKKIKKKSRKKMQEKCPPLIFSGDKL